MASKSNYVDRHNCHELVSYPHGPASFAKQLDEYLSVALLNDDGPLANLGQRLVDQNMRTINSESRNRLAVIDADIVHEVDMKVKKYRWSLKSYAENPGFLRPEKDRRVIVHILILYEDDTPPWSISIPLQFLLKGWGNAEGGYQTYSHSIYENFHEEKLHSGGSLQEKEFERQFFYLGITGRNWLKRMNEHLYEVRSGSNKLFHRYWREHYTADKVSYQSELILVNQEYKEAMSWEEWAVDEQLLQGNCLNMIPGGFKGMKFLHEHRFTRRDEISLGERDRAEIEYARQNPRKGIPNPMISELWLDDDYYERVIGAREKTLSPDQVRQIRYLASISWSADRITEEVGALNEEQVRNVLKGKTYRRVH